MAHAYTPGLRVTVKTTVQRRRLLPIKGKVLVKVGDTVEAKQVVAETFMPGDIEPMNVANILSLPPSDVTECMLKKEGDRVELNEPIAQTKGFFGMFRSEAKASAAGTVETVSDITGQVMIRGEPVPVRVQAFLAGRIVEVIPDEGVEIEAEVSFLQGIFGIGGETYGRIHMGCAKHEERLEADRINAQMKGAVVVGGGRVTADAIKGAVSVGAAGIVTGGIDDQDLRDFLGYDLGVAITGSEKVGITLVITEGFGDIAMAERSFDMLKRREGSEASISGATQIRAGVIRPEVLIPIDASTPVDTDGDQTHSMGLEVGNPVRVIRAPYFGRIGKVAGLPSEPYELESGSMARVLEVSFNGGERVIVPRANVELIDG